MPYNFQNHHILALDSCEGLEQYDNIDVRHIYRDRHGIEKYWYRLQEHLGCRDMRRWYGDWQHKLADYDTVLISDGIRGRDVVEYINQKNPQARVIISYLNSVLGNGRNNPRYYKNLHCEFYTFDKINAVEYGIQYKHFYYPHIQYLTNIQEHCSLLTDVFFVGVDKGRFGTIMALEKTFRSLGLSTNMLIVRQRHRFYCGAKKKRTLADTIPYKNIAKYICQSRAILDIVQEHQHGMTYRPMEALLFQKKLITNYQEIREYNFYHPQNIFVLNSGRPLAELPEFLRSDFVPVREDIKREYYPEVWLDGFFT